MRVRTQIAFKPVKLRHFVKAYKWSISNSFEGIVEYLRHSGSRKENRMKR